MDGISKHNEFVRTRPVILTENSHGPQPQESTLSDCVIVLMHSSAVTVLVCLSRWQIVQDLNKVCQAVMLALKGTQIFFESQPVTLCIGNP